MFLAALLLSALSRGDPIDPFSESYSTETKKHYEAYLICFAKGAYDRRLSPGSAEAHMREAKAACRKEYDAFVDGVVKDLKGSSDATTAAAKARSFLDEMDARAIVGPPAPTKLAQLPVEQFIGSWRMGNGPLTVDMNVQSSDDGSMVGTLTPGPLSAGELKSWTVTSDGTKQAVLHATFVDLRSVEYHTIPSFPSEMDFINPADPKVQRIDLTVEDGNLLLRLVTRGGGAQLRFHRQVPKSSDR
jgi:hypothetical protein